MSLWTVLAKPWFVGDGHGLGYLRQRCRSRRRQGAHGLGGGPLASQKGFNSVHALSTQGRDANQPRVQYKSNQPPNTCTGGDRDQRGRCFGQCGRRSFA